VLSGRGDCRWQNHVRDLYRIDAQIMASQAVESAARSKVAAKIRRLADSSHWWS
jgi:hypothetical protein